MTHCVADLKMREAGTAEPVLPPPIVKSKAANLLLSRLLNQNQNFFWGGPSKILDFCWKQKLNKYTIRLRLRTNLQQLICGYVAFFLSVRTLCTLSPASFFYQTSKQSRIFLIHTCSHMPIGFFFNFTEFVPGIVWTTYFIEKTRVVWSVFIIYGSESSICRKFWILIVRFRTSYFQTINISNPLWFFVCVSLKTILICLQGTRGSYSSKIIKSEKIIKCKKDHCWRCFYSMLTPGSGIQILSVPDLDPQPWFKN